MKHHPECWEIAAGVRVELEAVISFVIAFARIFQLHTATDGPTSRIIWAGSYIYTTCSRRSQDLVSLTLDVIAIPSHIEDFPGGYIVNRNQHFVERRPQGDYAVRKPNSDRASIVKPTQAEAIDWAQAHNPPGGQILVERVRNTNRGHPDKWRKP